ncbi:phage tail protein, P2 protein I family [Pseudovibrio ascidiaceicola]|uniref:Phage tail protein, P2 protein I family n=1 Tax=Pseudovibrio ascidiaceicola TaxID=285279 RepID=A0A1I4E1M8_9HYPH|nr:phage tail protein I [Pseudovibrio ascidiaceicola]SFK98236.1 phage tail protein, P2 protein I family [Pseudovibrio ascidiaceicola]
MSDEQPSRRTMLPPNSAAVAVALDLVEDRMSGLPADVIRDCLDPLRAPASLLDHLGWELSVDVWDRAWPEQVKRRVLSISEEVHKYKGTPYSIKTALKALGVTAHLLEWWQEGGSGVPGTFEITAYANEQVFADGPVLDARLQENILSTISATKPKSRGFSFQIGAQFESSLSIGLAGRSNAFTQPMGAMVLPQSGAMLGAGTMARSVAFLPKTAEPVLPQMGTDLGCAATARGHSFLSLHGELLT